MTRPQRFRKKPVEIEAVQWDGTEAAADVLYTWTTRFTKPAPGHGAIQFLVLGTDDAITTLGSENDKVRRTNGYTAVIYDELHETWVNAATGDWIIKGVLGEFYPCKAHVFADTYEAV